MTHDEHTPPEGTTEAGSAPLVPCPLCGAREGYHLEPSNICRWWNVFCGACGSLVTECRSGPEKTPPDRCAAADAVWNEAGAYAEGLREHAERYRDWMGIRS